MVFTRVGLFTGGYEEAAVGPQVGVRSVQGELGRGVALIR